MKDWKPRQGWLQEFPLTYDDWVWCLEESLEEFWETEEQSHEAELAGLVMYYPHWVSRLQVVAEGPDASWDTQDLLYEVKKMQSIIDFVKEQLSEV